MMRMTERLARIGRLWVWVANVCWSAVLVGVRLTRATAAALLIASVAHAQTSVNQGQKIAWDHDMVGVEKFQTAIDTVESWTDSGRSLEYTIPALTPGLHTFAVRACNIEGRCSAAATLAFQMVAIVPAMPTQLRIVSPAPSPLAAPSSTLTRPASTKGK
jgi:hypothetical protein